MHTEFEAKFYPLPYTKEEFQDKLTSLGALCKVQERLMKRVLFGKEKNTQIQANYIRVRDEGLGTITMSGKIHATTEGALSDQKEIELHVDSFQHALTFLEVVGLQQTEYQENKRESWIFEKASVEIDTWPGLATYCEIEAISEQEVERIAHLLGLDWTSRRITSPLEIYQEKYGLTREETKEKMRMLTFEHCEFGE